MTGALWITEAEVVRLMALPQAIEALRNGLAEEAGGRAMNMVKTHAACANGATLHAIGAAFEGRGTVGTKTWAHTANGAMPLLILFDAENGAIQAIIEAFALGQMRTGGISGLGTDVLARADATCRNRPHSAPGKGAGRLRDRDRDGRSSPSGTHGTSSTMQ